MLYRALKLSVDVPDASVTSRVRVLLRSSPWPLNHWYEPDAGAPSSVVTCLAGSGTTMPCGLAELYSCGPMVSTLFVPAGTDRKSTRLNSSHVEISYAVFCLKKQTAESR